MKTSGLHKIKDLLLHRGTTADFISEEQKMSFFKSWSDEYGNKQLPDKDPYWHSFSYSLTKHLAGNKAIEAYNKLYFKDFMIISSNPKLTGIICSGHQSLEIDKLMNVCDTCSELYDLYISHSNLKWTFVITHESDFGPYFSSLNLP